MFGIEYIAQERQQEYHRQAAQERLVRKALAGQQGALRVVSRTIGSSLVRLGLSLQGQQESVGPVAPLNMSRHHV